MQTTIKPLALKARSIGTEHARVITGLMCVFGLALLLRTVMLGYDLPNIYHPDEPVYVNIIARIYHGELNPHFFNYPTLFFYLNSLAYVPYFGIARLLGYALPVLPSTSLVMGSTLAQTPEAVLVSRGLSVLFGLGAIALLVLIGRQLSRSLWVGLLAGLLLAISPTAVKINRFVTPDTFVVFFILATVFFSLRLYRNGRERDYWLAGICAGLAASSKYNAGLAVLAPLAAHFMRHGWNGLVVFAIYRAMLASALAFLFTSPFVLLDAPAFWEDFTYEAKHYSTGHSGMEGNTLNWYLTYLWRVEGAGTVLGAVAMLVGFARSLLWRKPASPSADSHGSDVTRANPLKEWLVVFVFPLFYFLFISRFVVRNDRTLLPVIPFLLLAAALLLAGILRRAGTGLPQAAGQPRAATWELPLKKGWLGLGLLGLLLVLLVPALTFVQYATIIDQPVPEVLAREWIKANLPMGTRIAIESYTPYLERNRYEITPLYNAIAKDLNWYRSEGIEYLVLGKAMYGRYYCDPVRYYTEKAQYDRLFRAFDEVAAFPSPITRGPLDALAARLGDTSICTPKADLIYTHDVRILKIK